MTSLKRPNKIQIRAQVLSTISKFKGNKRPYDSDIEQAIEEFRGFDNDDLVIATILKEIEGTGELYDNILSLILLNLKNDELLGQKVIESLCDTKVSDRKKLYLINILREQGQKIDYNFINSCVEDADKVIDSETQKFLQEAKFSPEAQIDFYDFYFTVNEEDKNMLISSITNDYTGDELANILVPFAYLYPNNCLNETILDALATSKSEFAYEPLEYVANNNEKYSQYAKNCLNKLKISGVRNKPEKEILYKELLKGSKPLGFYYSLADGNSNISCVFAREKEDKTIQTFFNVFNLNLGTISSFGFNEMLKEDFEIVLKRFFKSSLKAKLTPQEGKKLFDYFEGLNYKTGQNIPYEHLCWRQLTYDIKNDNDELSKFLTKNLKKILLSEKIIEEILNSAIFENWFLNVENSEKLKSIIANIDENEILNIEEIEQEILKKTDELLLEDKERITQKITYQSYILAESKMSTTANSLYSTTFSDDALKILLRHIFKKSIYEHYYKNAQSSEIKGVNIFRKIEKSTTTDFAKKLVKAIEEKWT